MTDEQIIKALECCEIMVEKGCAKCPYHKVLLCAGPMSRDALDLINRQKAEIETLSAELERQENYAFAERDNAAELYEKLKDAKAEAIKEFAEMLKENSTDIVLYGEVIPMRRVERLVKEMVGDE